MKVAGVLVLANVTIKGANFGGLERRKDVVPIRNTFKVCSSKLAHPENCFPVAGRLCATRFIFLGGVLLFRNRTLRLRCEAVLKAWELHFGAGFLLVKATLGTGACLLRAASVLQCHGVLLFRNRPLRLPQRKLHATFMQPLQCILQHHVTNLHLSTHRATPDDNNHGATPMRSATKDSRNA